MALHTAAICSGPRRDLVRPPSRSGLGGLEVLEPVEAGQLGHHRLQGQRHVRAGVAVGHRVDVQGVERLLVEPQDVPVGRHRRREVGRPEPAD